MVSSPFPNSLRSLIPNITGKYKQPLATSLQLGRPYNWSLAHLGAILSKKMGASPLLFSVSLPSALLTTLRDNYLCLVRQGKGFKLNSHWLSLIAFLDLLDYKLNWRNWLVALQVRRLSMYDNVCVRRIHFNK